MSSDISRLLSTYRYAAYGSNLHPLRLQKRVPSAQLLGTTHLDSFELTFNKVSWKDGSGKCNIVPSDKRVYLAIFEILETERAILDGLEGVGYGYTSTEISLDGFGACWTYVADSGAIDARVLPTDWYKEIVRLGCLANEFPEFYLQAVEAVSAVEDTNASRAREQWKIVQELRDAISVVETQGRNVHGTLSRCNPT